MTNNLHPIFQPIIDAIAPKSEPQDEICRSCEGTGRTGYPPQSKGVKCERCNGGGTVATHQEGQ